MKWTCTVPLWTKKGHHVKVLNLRGMIFGRKLPSPTLFVGPVNSSNRNKGRINKSKPKVAFGLKAIPGGIVSTGSLVVSDKTA